MNFKDLFNKITSHKDYEKIDHTVIKPPLKCEAEITTAYRVNGKLVATKEEVAKECLLRLAEDYENNLTCRRMHYIGGFWSAHTAANFASKHIDEIIEILEQ